MRHSQDSPRARRATPSQVAEWRRLIDMEGFTPAELAREAGVQPRTVRLAVGRVQTQEDLRDIRRERLRRVVEAHDADVLLEAERLKHALSWPPPMMPVAQEALDTKRREALLMHLKGSAVPSKVGRLIALACLYRELRGKLESSLQQAVNAPNPLEGGGVTRLMDIADGLVVGRQPADLGYKVEGGWLKNGAYGLISEVESPDEPRARKARDQFERLEKELVDWSEVERLRALHDEWADLQKRVVGAMEDIALRQLAPGTCKWCPSEP